MEDRFARITAAASRRPLLTLAIVGVLALAGALGALVGLHSSASTDTLVDKSSSSYDATKKYRDLFGGDPVVIMAKGDLRHTVETSDLGRLLELEGCLAGNVPAKGLKTLPPVCTTLAKEHPVKVVYGPGTFVNTAAGEILDGLNQRKNQKAAQAQQAAAAARQLAAKRGYPKAQQDKFAQEAGQLVYAQFFQEALQIALKYGFKGMPSLDNVDFVDNLVFDPSRGSCAPKAKFAYLFPNCKAALIQVRLKPGLSDSQRTHAINLIRQATFEKKFRPKNGAHYVV